MKFFDGFLQLNFIELNVVELATLLINFLTPEEINALLIFSALSCTWVLIIYYHTVPEDEKKKKCRELKNKVRRAFGFEEINDGGDDI